MMEAEEGDMSSSPTSEVVGWLAMESGSFALNGSNKLEANITSTDAIIHFPTPCFLMLLNLLTDTKFALLKKSRLVETTHGNDTYIVIDDSSGKIDVSEDTLTIKMQGFNNNGSIQ